MYTDYSPGAFIHCNTRNQDPYTSEYDKCETKHTPDLEYFQCIYKIYLIPEEQVILLGKLHYTILKCKDCEYTRNWKFKNPKFCTNKAEPEYYKTHSDCLLNYISINEEELKKADDCTMYCYNKPGIFHYSKCIYDCYKDISKKIVESEPKVTTFVNITKVEKSNEGEGDKKSNAKSNLYSLNIYYVIMLTFLIIFIIN
jgi:hypothetical protein